MKGTFDQDSDACLAALQDLFLARVNQNRENRIRMNSQHPMMKSVPRILFLTRIFVYVSLDDCFRLGQTCLHFNQLIKSPLFVKMQVKMHQNTKIDVSLGTFGPNDQPSLSSIGLNHRQIQMSKSFNSELQNTGNNSNLSTPAGKKARGNYREDNEAELETLRNVKIFLTDKLKQNE